ncbi:MAG: hypothetical protein KGL67_00760 [Patescibacteria group bacterium]|nr:hypothetical protein [Patescibacteria group bacterium]
MNTLNIILVILALWAIPWKVYAVWLACERKEKVWFVVLLLVNTVGILEIFYIFKIVKKPWVEVKHDFKGAWRFFKQVLRFKKK